MDIGGESVLPTGLVEQNDGEGANLSDVFDVISQYEPTFGAGAAAVPADNMPHPPAPSAGPYTKIVEQPAGKALRFRYECEGRSAGSIPGVNSTPENRTYPTIKICGYRGRVVIVVSCITKEDPYKPHPHNLVGRDCHRGVCTVRETIDSDTCQVQFKNLGIQCVKRRDIAEALRVREELRVDPFRTRYAHKNQPQSIDLNAVRLCFQVFMTDDTGKVRQTLTPVVSDVIYDKKAMSELQIAQISHCSGSAKGGTRVILLCEKVNREDTAVVFFQEENKKVVWEERAHIEAVHKLVAIVFQTPPYRHPNTTEHVTVQLQLQRLTDNARSSPVSFEYIPARLYSPDSGYIDSKKRKRPPSILQEYEHDRGYADQKPIKSEPRDKTSPHALGNQYGEQWLMPEMPVPGPSHLQHPYAPMNWPASPYSHPMSHSPNIQEMSPMHPGSPNVVMHTTMHALSPNLQVPSTMGQVTSPMGQVPSPMGSVHSPMGQVHSPMGQVHSPMGQVHSPMGPVMPMDQGMGPVGGMSPGMPHMSHISPIHATPTYTQMGPAPALDSASSPSLSSLLAEGRELAQLNSGDLANLSSLLAAADRSPDLSDSLNRLSTSDLLQP
ncbi:transcription factor p65-like isoform X3 [Achroia grisella]|uniref:transcription factor p65-like isoform X3 n=1 Tax=Achroia grisella TaxID=688607 RepID=UPI0027D2991F|nr:transcription factor p65-like isoform X3 [Achroia grisella]